MNISEQLKLAEGSNNQLDLLKKYKLKFLKGKFIKNIILQLPTTRL